MTSGPSETKSANARNRAVATQGQQVIRRICRSYRACRFAVLTACVATVWLASAEAFADEPLRTKADAPLLQPLVQNVEATALQDDATLHDVCLQGAKNGWAVGDRGTIWHTDDGGLHWNFVPTPPVLHSFSLYSVCFLTDKLGWIAGGTIVPVGGTPRGVIARTEDAGHTWTVLTEVPLPQVRHVQFFNRHSGILVGDRSTRFPGGVAQTSDGGATWQAFNSKSPFQWRAGTFQSPEQGIVVGSQGQTGTVSDGAVFLSGPGAHGLKAALDVTADFNGPAWLVGQGSLVLRSENQGVSWNLPPTELPRALENFVDFRCVAQQGQHVWMTGSPGSVVWHSADQGRTWEQQTTGDAAPLHAVSFFDDQWGVAVGRWGRISVTLDGGQTWLSARGGGRRDTSLVIQTQCTGRALPYLTRWSHEDGYRGEVVVMTRKDLGADAHTVRHAEDRLHHAVLTAGGNFAELDWRLPLSLPSLEHNRKLLIKEWTALTDRRLPETLLSDLVARIRTARPDIVLLDEPAEGDASEETVKQAILAAVQLASDESRFPDHLQLAALHPWTVKKVIVQRRPGTQGPISQDPFEILPRLNTTLDIATSRAQLQFAETQADRAGRWDYAVVSVSDSDRYSDRTLLADLGIRPASEARRSLPPLTTANFDELRDQTRHRRSISAISRSLSTQSAHGAQLLGQMQEIIRPLSPELAAQQLADLASVYRDQGEWGLTEATYAELITRYPNQPPAVEAMLWLVQFWSSTEMNWQRMRVMQASQSQYRTDPQVLQANFQKSLELANQSVTNTAYQLDVLKLPAGIQQDQVSGSPQIQILEGSTGNRAGDQRQMQLQRWLELAATVTNGLQTNYPQLFEDPQMQFVVASLRRRRDQHQQADEIYRTYLETLSADPWHIAARGEAYLVRPGSIAPKPLILCKNTQVAPVLDGLLSDLCWTDAAEVHLSGDAQTGEFVGTQHVNRPGVTFVEPQPLVMFAHDQKYLYVAARMPLNAQAPDDRPQLPGRTHDAELDAFDRLSLQFDVDRDYATFYEFQIDQRGFTREACWDNWKFNPEWFCAVERTEDSWNLECAIPLAELLPPEHITGTVWGVGLTRVIPGVAAQSWTQSGGDVPFPPLFGLIQFQ